jgi:hypothetical protein
MPAPRIPEQTRSTLPENGLAGPALSEAARRYVRDGEPLSTFLADLEVAYQVLDLPPPSTALVKQASIAWADEFVGELGGIACEDPLTGMSSPEHARVHLSSLYRGVAPASADPAGADPASAGPEGHALVVVSLVETCAPRETDVLEAAFRQSLRLATVAETVRTTFHRCDVITALDHGRVVAVVSQGEALVQQAEELAWLLRRRLPVSSAPRVLIETMPPTEHQAIALLDALSA